MRPRERSRSEGENLSGTMRNASTCQDVEKVQSDLRAGEQVCDELVSIFVAPPHYACFIDQWFKISFTTPPPKAGEPLNPLDWSQTRRLTTTLLISLCGLVSLMTASVMAPALPTIAQDLSLSPTIVSLTLSIYLLAFAFGPLLIGPLSEIYGRRPIWLACHAYFILWNTLCPVKKNTGMMVVGRFMAGLGGSVGVALPGPIMADIWRIEQRGKSIALSMFAPYLGAAVGPILGGFMTEQLSWPWLFWVVSIFDAVLFIVSFFVIKESYAPLLLDRKAQSLKKATGRSFDTIYTKTYSNVGPGIPRIMAALRRPFTMLYSRPIMALTSFFTAYLFGCYAILLTTYADIWTLQYHQSVSDSGLHYIAISVGSAGSSIVTGILTDLVWARLKARSKTNTSTPEFRVPLMIPGTILMPLGLLFYGISARNRLHWILTDVGCFLFVFGMMSSSQSCNAYITDEFGELYASANAAMRFVTNVMGFCFPLFAKVMYARLGYASGNGVLAGVFLVVGFPLPWVLWWWGAKIRGIGKVAS